MRNRDYWQMRFRQLEDARHKTDLSTILKLETQYQQAQQEIEGQISTWYQRFADNNGITMAEARQWMQGKDLQEFKWTVQQYIDYGRENALNGQWMKELENASAKFHISKLEALQIQTQQSLEKLFGNQADMIDRAMGRAYTGAYYRTAYELQKGFNVGFNVSGIDQKQLDRVLVKPWAADGFNFSERIWNNKNKLISELHGELSRNILTGQDPQKAINSLAKKMGASKSNAARLIQTEQAYFSSAAQAECFSDLGVEEYEIVATLDSRTSDICRNLDGQHFPMKDYEAGVTAPPFHVNCRSTTVPYFPDNFGQIGERAARDADGKTYYVPDDLKYSDWKAAFVDGNTEGFEEIQENHFHHEQKPDTIKVGKFALDDCKTTQEVEGLLKNQGWFYSEVIDGTRYDSNSATSLVGCDVESAKEVYKAYDRLYTKYPQLKQKLNGVNCSPLPKHTYAQCHVGLGHGGIAINERHYSNHEKLIESYERDLKAGFHPANTTYSAILTHEVGHAIDDYLTNTLHAAGMSGWKPKWVSAALRPKVMRACGLKISDIEKSVSGYATQNHFEWFAECFAEYMESPNPRPVAQKFGEMLEELLKGVPDNADA